MKDQIFNDIEPIEAASLYKLGLLNSDLIVILANYWLENSIYSDSLCEICLISKPIMSEIGPLFEEVMTELEIIEPLEIDAINIIITLILKKIVKKKINADVGASFLYWEIHNKLLSEFPDKQYVGDRWGLENIFCWLREIWDCRDGSMLLYYTNLPRNKAEMKFMTHLYKEAKTLLKNDKIWLANNKATED